MPPQTPVHMFQSEDGESAALDHLLQTVVGLQAKRWDSIRIVKESQIPTDVAIRHINSIVFTIDTVDIKGYVLAILDENDRVNVTRLEQAVVESTHLLDGDERRDLLSLAPIEQLSQICGFSSGTVPPLGLSPAPVLTVVEKSLVDPPTDDNHPTILVGGGGLPHQSILLSVQTLLDITTQLKVSTFREGPIVRHPSSFNERSSTTRSKEILSGHQNERFQKPFFAVSPPDAQLALQIIKGEDSQQVLQPEWVSIVGRISGVRQMARRLVFCDLAPPIAASPAEDIHPWRSPGTGIDMAVQLILGKTICQRMGIEQAELALRRVKPGQMVMIQGKTNVGNRDSLKNWVTKTSLDIVVYHFDHLQTETEGSVWTPTISGGETTKPHSSTKGSTAEIKPSIKIIDLPYLKLEDVYPDTSLDRAVMIVDDLPGIQRFHCHMMQWLETHPNQVGMVGLDAEWKPNFLAREEPQPVLLLQICLHDLRETFLMDLQTLLRPLCEKSEPMNEIESATSETISLLYQTERLVKVGFQLQNDLQRLAASYPHIHAFCEIHSVLEISKLGMKAPQMIKEASKARIATSSLVKMTEIFLQRTLNKEEQISDWSIRPLSHSQVEYAALDAIVTPYIADRFLSSVRARFTASPTITLGRMENDTAFKGFLTSWRFLPIHATETIAIQRWNAKRLVGDSFLVSQTWTSGDIPPTLPTSPSEDKYAPFVDLHGIRRVPSQTVGIDATKIDSMLGTWAAKSKERCVLNLVDSGEYDLDELSSDSSRLDFQARSGFVELANAVVLFVTLPTTDGRSQSRSYPNEWLEDGSILTWFIKEYDWQRGSSRLAEKMTDGTNDVILYVRRGKGIFFCCGRCRVVTLDAENRKNLGSRSDQWSILKLYLLLQDFGRLQDFDDFRGLVNC